MSWSITSSHDAGDSSAVFLVLQALGDYDFVGDIIAMYPRKRTWAVH